MRIGKKKESLLGIIVTAVLCLGFLWWWFRPAPYKWHEHDAVQLVERAAEEPRPESRVERQVLDFDLMEVALAQVREKRRDDAMAVAKHITDPVIRGAAARKLAHGYLGSDEQDKGAVLDFASLIEDPQQRAAVRTELLGLLAMAGFPDAAIPEAKTPLQKATLANRIGNSDVKVRQLLAEARAGLPALPPAEAAPVLRELARGQVALARNGAPDEAIAAIKTLPQEERGELWMDLMANCQGRPDAVLKVFEQIEEPAVRRRLEIESLVFGRKLRAAEDIIKDCQADVQSATGPAAKVAAMLVLSKVQYDADGDAMRNEATATLKEAEKVAHGIVEPAQRCRALLSLARRYSDVVQHDDSSAALHAAVTAARAETSPAQRIPLLVECEEETYKQSDEPGAVKLMEEAVTLIEQMPAASGAEVVETIASALVRRGQWARGLALVDRLTAEPVRVAALEAVANTAAEQCISVDPSIPNPRGEPFDSIRREAISDQVKAANLAEAQPEGFARARAWLAMAKALFTPPQNLNDYMAAGAQPPDGGPEEGLTPAPVTEGGAPPPPGDSGEEPPLPEK